MPTYCVSTYDSADEPGEDGIWTMVAEGVLLWKLRPILRRLKSQHYSRVSIAIEEE